ncbi:MAG: UDP-N-acetylglucosamine 1-carboxyvinyltransferase [Candidatus Babeliaceae bacterium]|nr:UDP-N-acetylglucosamine 1-carboxyvinyltransferase [Candidatus Babeliaceae bacterium]
MVKEYLRVFKSAPLCGEVKLSGAKNAVLVTMASLLLAVGRSRLHNVPASFDVFNMIELLKWLGVLVVFDSNAGVLDIDTSCITSLEAPLDIVKKMRASILVMGPLLARYGSVRITQPGGDSIGSRPIDFHLKAFARMGAEISFFDDAIEAKALTLSSSRFILDYPSVGATENILMAAVLAPGVTVIENAAFEPEVFELVAVLRKMGALIELAIPATILVRGVKQLEPVEYTVMPDRLEAGTLLLAVAATGGEVEMPNAPVQAMSLFIEKLRDMGHLVTTGESGLGLSFKAHLSPRAISFKTMPYPGYPTDLQSPTMAVLSVAEGTSVITETVFDNRMLHVPALQKMGADIEVRGATALIKGVAQLRGGAVEATDIRAAAALAIAGLMAEGETIVSGVPHLLRGYAGLDAKLRALGAPVSFVSM